MSKHECIHWDDCLVYVFSSQQQIKFVHVSCLKECKSDHFFYILIDSVIASRYVYSAVALIMCLGIKRIVIMFKNGKFCPF